MKVKALGRWATRLRGETSRLLEPLDRRLFGGQRFGGYRRAWALMALTLFLAAGSLLLIGLLMLPDFEPLLNPEVVQPSRVISLDNKELGRYENPLLPKPVKPAQVPILLKQAVVEMEDPKFYDHSGWVKRLGSTLTVRLARHLYDKQEDVSRSTIRRARELLAALVLERKLTKDEILTHYLNFAEFGGVVQGVENAARKYFGKTAADLAPEECAQLAGMLRAPTTFHPRLHPDRSLERRNTVLNRLADQGAITAKEYAQYVRRPVRLAALKPDSLDPGLAPYFMQYVKEWMQPWLEARKLDLHTAGLRIHVSLDTRLQRHAEAAVAKHLSQHQKRMDDYVKYMNYFRKRRSIIQRAVKQSDRYRNYKEAGLPETQIQDSFKVKRPMRIFAWNDKGYVDTLMSPIDSVQYYARILESGLMTIDPRTGHVLAWVGGVSHSFFKYDHVIRGKRQVGSTFKPFVYATAFERDYEVCSQQLNQPPEIPTQEGDIWRPQNADHDYGGMVSLRYGLVHSINVVTARLCQELGPEAVVEVAKRMGIQSELKAVPAVSLGTFDLTVAELTTAYAPIVNRGLQPGMKLVLRIEDAKGRIIEQFDAPPAQVIKPTTAHTMVELLRAVATNGTAGNVRYVGGLPWYMDLGGKTGTTQNSADGWYVGFTPHLVTGIWVGCSDRHVNFGHASFGRGSQMAMPIWSYYMASVYKDKKLGYKDKDRIETPRDYRMQIFCPADPIKRKTEEEAPTDSTEIEMLEGEEAPKTEEKAKPEEEEYQSYFD